MRRVHLIFGLLGVVTFLITGQLMKHHNPPVRMLTPEVRMMYVSRHIYLLGGTCESSSRTLPPGIFAGLATHAAKDRFRPDFSLRPVSAHGIHLRTSTRSGGAKLAKLLRLDWFIRGRDDPSGGSGRGRGLIFGV